MFSGMSPLERELIELAPTYMEPVYIGQPPGTSERVECAMGTATLLQLGSKRLAITCAHVMDELTRRAESGEATFFQLGDLVFDSSPDVLDYSSELDLVVIDITQHVLDRESRGGVNAGEASFYAPEHWPPEALSAGAVISFAGFPGAWREQVDVARFELYVMSHGATQVAAVGDNYLWTKIEPDKCVGWSAAGKDLQAIAGLSGGVPILVEKATRA